VLIQAAINGGRTREEHPCVPITSAQQADEAAAAVAAGAGEIHVHVRGAEGRESLAAHDVADALSAIREACPGIAVGVSTGAWIAADASQRLELIRSWKVLPDFASVNVHEDGAIELIELLLDRGINVEARVWTGHAAQALKRSGLAHECRRVLIEPAEDGSDAMTNFKQIETELGEATPSRLLHGLDGCAWEFVALAAERGYDTRIGFEDTLTLPDGTAATNNAALVAAAVRIFTRFCAGSRLISANGPPAA
jgi:uncharacterized protein (DUF849 family)